MFRQIFGTLLCLASTLPAAAWAGAVIQSLNGDVRVGGSKEILIAAREDQRLASGTTIVTGGGAQVVLKFDDGGQMVLGQNTEFRIVDSQFAQNSPLADRAVFDLVRGALRVVSGYIGARSRQAFALRTPQMTIGIRGTDFMVMVANQAYVNVSHGAVAISNGFGTSVIGAGSVAAIPSSAAAVTVVPASSLPASASTAFSSMGSAAGVTGGAGVGAAATTAGVAASGGVGLGTAAVVGAVAAGAAAAGGKGGSSPAQQHTAPVKH
jgi:hypothetical protein